MTGRIWLPACTNTPEYPDRADALPKTRVTPNGIDTGRLEEIPHKKGKSEMIQIGAVLRVTPIKRCEDDDPGIFLFAKKKVPAPSSVYHRTCDEDEEYAGECFELVETLGVSDVVFTGRGGRQRIPGAEVDMTILTSISEGQPLTILGELCGA